MERDINVNIKHQQSSGISSFVTQTLCILFSTSTLFAAEIILSDPTGSAVFWDNAFLIVMCSHTSVEPVNATLSTSMWLAMAAPAAGPKPGTMLTTPGGKPAWCRDTHRETALPLISCLSAETAAYLT